MALTSLTVYWSLVGLPLRVKFYWPPPDGLYGPCSHLPLNGHCFSSRCNRLTGHRDPTWVGCYLKTERKEDKITDKLRTQGLVIASHVCLKSENQYDIEKCWWGFKSRKYCYWIRLKTDWKIKVYTFGSTVILLVQSMHTLLCF